MPSIASRKAALSSSLPPPEFLALHSPACSALWELRTGAAPLWRYWGPRLSESTAPPKRLAAERPPTSWTLAEDEPLSIFPGLGTGWFGASALLAHRDRQDWTFDATECRVERCGDDALRFHLTDHVARLSVIIAARLDPASDTLTMTTTLINDGDAPLDVQWLAAATLPLPAGAQSVRSFTGRHNGEFAPVVDALSASIWRRENRRGITSHACFPGAVVTTADGCAYGAQLAWSGNHAQQIERGEDGRYHWQIGEWLGPGEIRLAPGESLTSPEVLATCSVEGGDGVAWAFHRAIRGRTTWPGGTMPPRPVHLNTWEAAYFAHDEADLMALASAAAALGIERFVLDDGWFRGRRHDRAGLGDWSADAERYPAGLAPLAAHVTALGMEFGLWVEPEMVNPDSDLYRAHPDWVLHVPGRPLLTARNQLVLDLARADVRAELFGQLRTLLDTLPIAYLKWDHNRDLTHAGTSPAYHAQVQGAYALIDAVRATFPHVEIEACAGGGGRIDAGIAQRTHRFWVSDNLDPFDRLAIQDGFLQFFPPELMGSHVGASPAHSTGRVSPMRLRAAVAATGAMGVELDPRRLDRADHAALAAAIAGYKQLRARRHGPRLWRGSDDDGLVWLLRGDDRQLLIELFRTASPKHRFAAPIRLPMLDRASRYAIRQAEAGAAGTLLVDGDWLRRVGWTPPALGLGDSALFFCDFHSSPSAGNL